MKSNSAPSPSPSTMLITGPQFNIVWGGEGRNFEKVSKVYKLISMIVVSLSCSKQSETIQFKRLILKYAKHLSNQGHGKNKLNFVFSVRIPTSLAFVTIR